MKANVENLVKVVEESAKSHFMVATHDEENKTIYVNTDNKPIVDDLEKIADAFFGNHEMVDVGLGESFICYNGYEFLEEYKEVA